MQEPEAAQAGAALGGRVPRVVGPRPVLIGGGIDLAGSGASPEPQHDQDLVVGRGTTGFN